MSSVRADESCGSQVAPGTNDKPLARIHLSINWFELGFTASWTRRGAGCWDIAIGTRRAASRDSQGDTTHRGLQFVHQSSSRVSGLKGTTLPRNSHRLGTLLPKVLFEG
jgi:hypothetical protein